MEDVLGKRGRRSLLQRSSADRITGWACVSGGVEERLGRVSTAKTGRAALLASLASFLIGAGHRRRQERRTDSAQSKGEECEERELDSRHDQITVAWLRSLRFFQHRTFPFVECIRVDVATQGSWALL